MTILFMGTPDFAVPSLEALIAAGHTICGVFTQPDRPKNRGMKLQAPPVKRIALAHDIPVFQPVTLKDGTALEEIRQLSPELIVVAAYGRLLPRKILELPAKGCINVHSSLLPKYRGAAPINWAVLNGEEETGVTIMYMAQELDAGDIIAQASTPIDPEETVESVHDRLAGLGARLLVQTVSRLERSIHQRHEICMIQQSAAHSRSGHGRSSLPAVLTGIFRFPRTGRDCPCPSDFLCPGDPPFNTILIDSPLRNTPLFSCFPDREIPFHTATALL